MICTILNYLFSMKCYEYMNGTSGISFLFMPYFDNIVLRAAQYSTIWIYSTLLSHTVCCAQSLSCVQLFLTPQAVTLCPWGFSRQEYWSGLSCPPPGDLPNPGIEPRSPALWADSLPSEPPGKPKNTGVGSLSLLQGILLTQEFNRGLLCCRWILYQLSYQGSPNHTLLFGIQAISHFLFSKEYMITTFVPLSFKTWTFSGEGGHH